MVPEIITGPSFVGCSNLTVPVTGELPLSTTTACSTLRSLRRHRSTAATYLSNPVHFQVGSLDKQVVQHKNGCRSEHGGDEYWLLGLSLAVMLHDDTWWRIVL